MENRFAKLTAVVSVATLLIVGAGCASIEDVKALRADVESLKGASASASADAEAARTEAGEASRTANRALSAAREAQTCCAANSERIERMFKKSMMK